MPYLILKPSLNSIFDRDMPLTIVGIMLSQAPVSLLRVIFRSRSLGISVVRAVKDEAERDKLDNLAALRPWLMVDLWSARQNVVWPRRDVVRREVHSVEVA